MGYPSLRNLRQRIGERLPGHCVSPLLAWGPCCVAAALPGCGWPVPHHGGLPVGLLGQPHRMAALPRVGGPRERLEVTPHAHGPGSRAVTWGPPWSQLLGLYTVSLEGTRAQGSRGQQQEPRHVTLGAPGALAVVTRALWNGRGVPGLSVPVAEAGVGFDGAGGGGIFPPLPPEASPIAVLPAPRLVRGCGSVVTGVTGSSGGDRDLPASCHQGSV